MREDILARRMFLGGCLGLPWLWIVNVWYFYPQVWGKAVAAAEQEEESQQQQQQQESENNNNEEVVNVQELQMWVKRSTYGAFAVMAIWVAWIVSFQTNKSAFGPQWFVMNQDEGDLTGW